MPRELQLREIANAIDREVLPALENCTTGRREWGHDFGRTISVASIPVASILVCSYEGSRILYI